ncbi:MAG: HAMP domain-containing protein [Candidatus Schekmanbacteria bacterium]|nr:MAG: HAMP domain-containing protein [Candidatus Schekmanbacteria bacterium]
MIKSFFGKIFAGYTVITILIVSFILIFSFNIIKGFYLNFLENDLAKIADSLMPIVKKYYEKEELQKLDSFVKNMGKKIGTRITVINNEGIVYADSEKDPNVMENHRTRDEIIKALEGERATSLRFSNTVKEEMLYLAIPIKEEDQIVGVLRVSIYLKDINSFLRNLKIRILEATAFILLASFLLSLLISKSFTKPIDEIVSTSNRLAEGDLSSRIILKGNDELNNLSSNLNSMAEKIEKSFTELRSKKEELTTIISSLNEGLLVIDDEDKVVIANESLKKVLKRDIDAGRYYWEIIRNPILKELIEETRKKGENLTSEIVIEDTDFFVSLSPVLSEKRIALVFQDISEIRKLELIKKDLISNVSHELRTPLTAIKGFAETLQDDVEGSAKEYVEIIRSHTERLINIVEDLLLLANLEEKNDTLNYDKIEINELIERVEQLFRKKAQRKGLNLILNLSDTNPVANIDEFKIEQMLINLIDNAIKYTEEGLVEISTKSEAGRVIIKIKDTGVGISEEEIPRIFERFYVADKSRSRKFGGTGLGLSIVKHIVLLHNGTIDVKSAPNKGTTFTITLPN